MSEREPQRQEGPGEEQQGRGGEGAREGKPSESGEAALELGAGPGGQGA